MPKHLEMKDKQDGEGEVFKTLCACGYCKVEITLYRKQGVTDVVCYEIKRGFWERVRKAFSLIFSSEGSLAEVCLSSYDTERLIKFFSKDVEKAQ